MPRTILHQGTTTPLRRNRAVLQVLAQWGPLLQMQELQQGPGSSRRRSKPSREPKGSNLQRPLCPRLSPPAPNQLDQCLLLVNRQNQPLLLLRNQYRLRPLRSSKTSTRVLPWMIVTRRICTSPPETELMKRMVGWGTVLAFILHIHQ